MNCFIEGAIFAALYEKMPRSLQWFCQILALLLCAVLVLLMFRSGMMGVIGKGLNELILGLGKLCVNLVQLFLALLTGRCSTSSC